MPKLISSPPPPQQQTKPIVFFDGECGLCNRFISLLLRIDAAGVFNIAPLHGKTAKKNLPKALVESLTTIVVLTHEQQVLVRSDAVIYVATACGLPYSLLATTSVIPRFIRDWVYDLIANNRHRLFAGRGYCVLPGETIKERLLD